MAERRIVHAQVVADPADHDLARVDPQTDREVQTPRRPQLVGIAPHLVAEMERRPAGALGVVLVRDRGAEERHDAVPGVLVHRPLEAMHALGEDLEEAVHDPVPVLGVELLGELHRPLHVGEEDRHLLALALEGLARGQDFLREVLGRVGRGSLLGGRGRGQAQRGAAVAAELLAGVCWGAARGARPSEASAAFRAKAAFGTIAVSARGTRDSRLRFHDSFAPVAPPELVVHRRAVCQRLTRPPRSAHRAASRCPPVEELGGDQPLHQGVLHRGGSRR